MGVYSKKQRVFLGSERRVQLVAEYARRTGLRFRKQKLIPRSVDPTDQAPQWHDKCFTCACAHQFFYKQSDQPSK